MDEHEGPFPLSAIPRNADVFHSTDPHKLLLAVAARWMAPCHPARAVEALEQLAVTLVTTSGTTTTHPDQLSALLKGKKRKSGSRDGERAGHWKGQGDGVFMEWTSKKRTHARTRWHPGKRIRARWRRSHCIRHPAARCRHRTAPRATPCHRHTPLQHQQTLAQLIPEQTGVPVQLPSEHTKAAAAKPSGQGTWQAVPWGRPAHAAMAKPLKRGPEPHAIAVGEEEK